MKEGGALPDYIAEHKDGQVYDQMYVAEVLFVLLAMPKERKEGEGVPDTTPLRLAVCNLFKAERMVTYPGAGVWDVRDMGRPGVEGGQPLKVYGVEAASLVEKLAMRPILAKGVVPPHNATSTSPAPTGRCRFVAVLHQSQNAGNRTRIAAEDANLAELAVMLTTEPVAE